VTGRKEWGVPADYPDGQGQIRVVKTTHAVPFSKGLLAQSLTATGLSPDRAYRVAMEVERNLRESVAREISITELRTMVGRVLETEEGPRYYSRYEMWHGLAVEDRPVIILIGGATGVGKSTVATELAHTLGITRIISTDTVRQVMRAFFSAQLMPAIHYSSFDADQAIRMPLDPMQDPHVLGFAEQTQMVNVGIKAVIDRALREGMGMVMEGVHVVPGFTGQGSPGSALILPMVVAVRDEDLHRSHFLIREQQTDGRRPFQRYVANFGVIRKIQDYILSRAEAEGTMVIENLNIDDAVSRVVDSLYALIEGGA
jgi:2-phosphoglycerate kinase